MKIYSVYDKEFNEYGEIVKLIDFAELLNVLHTKEAPSDGTIYVPSDDDLEKCKAKDDIEVNIYE